MATSLSGGTRDFLKMLFHLFPYSKILKVFKSKISSVLSKHDNSLVCKWMTTFSLLLLVSLQLENIIVFLQNEFVAKCRYILRKISGLNSGMSSELSSMKSISPLVLAIESLLRNLHLSPYNGR